MDKHLQILGLYCFISFAVATTLHGYVLLFKKRFFRRQAARGYFHLSDSQYLRLNHEAPHLHLTEVIAYVFTWYGISLALTMFNKWFLVYFNGGFPFPLTASAFHMIIKLLISRAIIYLQGNGAPEVTTQIYLRMVIPIGVATALDVGASNLSFQFVTVTFYTILKSGALIWLLFWAVLVKIEKLDMKVSLIVGIISAGLMVASFGQTDFSFVGFVLVMGSSCCSGLRWAMTQLLGAAAPDQARAPLPVIYLMAPASALGLLPFCLVIEAPHYAGTAFFRDAAPGVWWATAGMVLAGGAVSFLLVFAEVKLVELTSALTMGVFGQVKEILTIALSMAVFGDHLTALNAAGLAAAMAGTAWYKREKFRTGELGGHGSGAGAKRPGVGGELDDIFGDLIVTGEDDSLTSADEGHFL